MVRARFAVWLLCAVLSTWVSGLSGVAAQGERGGTGATEQAPPGVADGAAIKPEFAEGLFKRLAPMQEVDGCRLARFDTHRFRIRIGLARPSGAEQVFELATAPDMVAVDGRVGSWVLSVPPELERDCGATLGAVRRVLQETAAPQGSWWGSGKSDEATGILPSNHAVLAATFVLLMLGTVAVLIRELRTRRPSLRAVLALVLVCAAALALRLTLSPQTFLHEYYHIAETVPGYLTGEIPATYGKTGPAMFRLVGSVVGRPEDVHVIFLTTALVSSLAIPALALLDLAVMASWPRALCIAVLFAVLPKHLRFAAAEDLYVQALTFGLWALALFALYLRTRRFADVLLAALALSLAMQARPEMLLFPGILVAMVLLVEPRSWRVLFARRTLLALGVLAVLLIPRVFEFQRALGEGGPTPSLPPLSRYLYNLILLNAEVTPPLYWVLGVLGLAWDGWRRPGYHLWAVLVFVGYTLLSLSMFDNPPYNLRSQIMPTCFLLILAAGVGSLWMALWGRRRESAMAFGGAALAGIAALVLLGSRGFVTELRDQQLEWLFLQRTVTQLPRQATLLSAVETGGKNLDAFPEFLLRGAHKSYDMVDVRRAAKGEVAWPAPAENLIYYQGMFCYIAFDNEPSPEPMTPVCQAVHDRYLMEPLAVEELDVPGYSAMRYAPRPYRIGFYRLRAPRDM